MADIDNKPMFMPHPSLRPQAASASDLEALESQHFIDSQDPLAVAAAGWLVRRQEGLDAEDDAELRAWLDASPAHGPALAQMEQMMGRVDALPRAQVRGAVDHARSAPQSARGTQPSRWRRRAVGTAAMLCVIAFSGWWGWNAWQQPTFSQTFVTARGEQRRIELPDGSRLWLDTDTEADIKLYRGHREVRLPHGQAHFAVHPDPQHPFDVYAGPLRITVVGTRFSVRNTSTGLRNNGVGVVVDEGRVRVTPRQDPQHAVLLTAGQSVGADGAGTLGAVAQVAVTGAAADAAAWREGRVNFAGATLAQAVAEFERYGDTGLVVRDPRVAALRVRGSFDLQRIDAFASALPQVLPVRLKPGAGGKAEIVSAAGQ